MKLRTEIEIDASIKTVWRIIADLQSYSEWNQVIPSISGGLGPGGRVQVKSGQSIGEFVVLRYHPGYEIRMSGKLEQGLEIEYAFVIEPAKGSSIHFILEERLNGSNSSASQSGEKAKLDAEKTCQAIKQRAEAIERLLAEGSDAGLV